MPASNFIEESLKTQPYYAEAATAVLIGLGILGPELTAALAIILYGLSVTGPAKPVTPSLPPLKPTSQDCLSYESIIPAILLDDPSALDRSLQLKWTEEQVPETCSEHAKPCLSMPEESSPTAQLLNAQRLPTILIPVAAQECHSLAASEQGVSNQDLEPSTDSAAPLIVHKDSTSLQNVLHGPDVQLRPEIAAAEQGLDNTSGLTEMQQLRSRVSELDEKLYTTQCDLRISQKRLEEQDESEQNARARVSEMEKKNSALNNLLSSRLSEVRELKTELMALRAQTAFGCCPDRNKILGHPQDLQARFTRSHTCSKREDFPPEMQQHLVSTMGSGYTLEAQRGEVQYILVDIEKPQSIYCFPIHNQILFTMGSTDCTVHALQPGLTMENVYATQRNRFRYEIEFGDMFARCIVRSSKPLVDVHFDYTMRLESRIFPSTMLEHLGCQNATDTQLDGLAPYARYHREHLGLKASLLVVNKQCFPFAALRASEGVSRVDDYTGDEILVRNGNRDCWDFHMMHVSKGGVAQLLVGDVAAHLADLQPWHDDGKWYDLSRLLPTYLLPNEIVRGQFVNQYGHDFFGPTCPEYTRLQPVWENSKRVLKKSQHRVRDTVDPVHFYRRHMNIVSTDLFCKEEQERDLALADGRSFHGSDFSDRAFSNVWSDIACVCEYYPGFVCRQCCLKFHNCSYSSEDSANACQGWVETLPYEDVGPADYGCQNLRWNGEIAFESAGTLRLVDYEVSFMGLEATPDAVAPGDDMRLPVGPWTGEPETVVGRYMHGGHLMVDAVGIKWIRFFPLTGHYIVSATIINKIQRFGVHKGAYSENHPSWKEFCDQRKDLTCSVDHPKVGAVLHTRTYVDKMIIDYTLPFAMGHPIYEDIAMGQVYNEYEMEEFYHLEEDQISQILPMFRDDRDKFFGNVGQMETLCPWRYKFYDEDGKLTIPAPRTYKVTHPRRPRVHSAPRKQNPKLENPNAKAEGNDDKQTPRQANVAKAGNVRKAPSLVSDNSSEDSPKLQPYTPELKSTRDTNVKLEAVIPDTNLAS
ncbi:hypothetical protein FKW77_005294 [Venturia effusa]|uniref:Uncharacterized protein n=1 Tax=Venturia effusa TaxID=50376 RepID=A0A517LH63_9PEZI|nr:hypothetical protein FKW77_005294 [Venturia effusa]